MAPTPLPPDGEGIPLDLDEALGLAVTMHRSGRLTEAASLYQAILRHEPEHPDALHFLGVLHHMVGEEGDAEALIRRAIAAAPGHADAHNNLGNVLRETDRPEEALAAYRRAIELAPGHVDAHSNLGALLRARGEFEASMQHLRTALEMAPDHTSALDGLGKLLGALGRHEEALEVHTRCLRVSGQSADQLGAIGSALYNLDRFDEALASYQRALNLQPKHASARQGLARTLVRAGRTAEAAEVYREWLELVPDNPTAEHLLAACGGGGAPERAGDAYVAQTFDQFAESFDTVLAHLQYRAPELTAGALARILGTDRAGLEVLDAGCGTGLCGPLLRPYARRLSGVDLSSSMLSGARARGVYDALHQGELVAFLRAHRARFDVICSADTLVYFGDLVEFSAQAAAALREGGLLIATFERMAPDAPAPEGFRLLPHGRYCHGREYLEACASGAGLQVLGIEAEHLRLESGTPVPGWVLSARRAG